MTAPLLSIRDLAVTFSSRGGPVARAVDGVDLEVGAREVVAVVGESGSGKTTLARTILGLERPTEGTIEFDGSALPSTLRKLRSYRRRVQLVLQDPTASLNPRQTVYELVAEGIRIHRMVSASGGATEVELVDRALTRSGLRPAERFFLRYPHELSGGQRQRVVIAGAMALEPDMLIADEPVSSLDASIRGEILALLLRLRDDFGLTVLVITHDLGLAWNIADRIAVMYLGRLVECGPTERVLADPQHPYTQSLLSVVPEMHHIEPVVLTGETPDPTRMPRGCRFHPRCPALEDGRAEAAGIVDACRGKPLPVLDTVDEHSAACWLATSPAAS